MNRHMSRKFILCVLALADFTVLVVGGWIDGAVFQVLAIAALSIYVGGNVGKAYIENKGVGDDRKNT